MISSDIDTIKVYFSQHLKAFKCWKNIEKALMESHVTYAFLPNTKDYWVRELHAY